MSEIEILENLKKYLQFLLDNGTHKIFYNDLFWSEKTIDCINAINDLQQENKQLKDLCNKYEEEHKTTFETWLKEINILTELEEWLKENAGICRLNQKYATNQVYGLKEDVYYRCLNKIQELKEKYK